MTIREGYIPTADGPRLFCRMIGDGGHALVIPNGPPLTDQFSTLANGRTLVLYDARNRGQSDLIDDQSQIAKGILHDVDDIESVRRHLHLATIDLLGHSYMGLGVILYAMRFPQHVRRIVQIGPVAPTPGTQYSPDLSYVDDVMTATLVELRALLSQPASADPETACRHLWQTLRRIYVVNPSDVDKLDGWQRCHLATERRAAQYIGDRLIPSYMAMHITSSDIEAVTMPVLTIHGRKDRTAPYGGGRDWAAMLPDGRLLTIDDGGHMPWIEAPIEVLSAIDDFLR
jgi:pimeloyl-ACP methyl ester carboxylesterase